MKRISEHWRALVLLLAVVALSGCAAEVKPWERGDLARTEMAWSSDPLEDGLEDHIYFSKEASSGGGNAGGGGCGCN